MPIDGSKSEMRLFQNYGLSRSYASRLKQLTKGVSSFVELRRIFLHDRYGASHLLKPVNDNSAGAFFTNGDDEQLQRAWAQENGLKAQTPLEDILLAQIEAHRTEVFYNLDPVRYPSRFVARLPQCVKRKLAWRAAPSGASDFGAYDLILCNFPSFIEKYKALGWRAAHFTPSHDPEMSAYAANEDRPIDVLFVGGYSRHHADRAKILDAVAGLRDRYAIEFCLDRSRLTALAETPLGLIGPLRPHRRTSSIRAVSAPPVFGRQLYEKMSRAKIVLNGNGAIDIVGRERGNMRCWETLGLGAAMLSDEGDYPDGMEPDVTMCAYHDGADAVAKLQNMLSGAGAHRALARAGSDMLATRYSNKRLWERFAGLL